MSVASWGVAYGTDDNILGPILGSPCAGQLPHMIYPHIIPV